MNVQCGNFFRNSLGDLTVSFPENSLSRINDSIKIELEGDLKSDLVISGVVR